MKTTAVRLSLALLLISACKPGAGSRVYDENGDVVSEHVVKFTVLQLNDVYEIAPVESGLRGGLARVATLKKKLLEENPNTFAVLDGDFLSPSAIGASKLDGKAVNGAQMVAALNAMGLDYAAFGNHELDVPESDLKARIAESKFEWVTSNVMDAQGNLYPGVKENKVVEFKNAQGDAVKVGFFGVCIDMAKKPWVKYKPAIATAKEEVQKLRDQGADVLLGITHLSLGEDKQLAGEVPELEAQFGGHEHENMAVLAGVDNQPIYKADANARTVYVHRFRYDVAGKKVTHQSQLIEIDRTIPEEPQTAAVVKGWVDKVWAGLRAQGIEPTQVVGKATEVLIGTEEEVRNQPTNLSLKIADAFLKEDAEADAAIYGSGSIRIDDKIPPGDITMWDIYRIFPFGGKLYLVSIPGALLRKAVEQGDANKGTGGYLVRAGIGKDAAGQWTVKGQALDDGKTYKVLFNDFLLTGLEKGLGFLNTELESAEVRKLRETREVRAIFVSRLKAEMP